YGSAYRTELAQLAVTLRTPKYPLLFLMISALARRRLSKLASCLFFFPRRTHERLRAGCNGGNSWNYFERITRQKVPGFYQGNQQEEGWQNWRFAALASAQWAEVYGPQGSDCARVLESVSLLG